MKIHEFVCSVCKREVKHESTFTTGYARNDEDEKICYECCAVADKKHMEKHGRITLYLTLKEGKHVIGNWPSTLQYPVIGISEGHHNIARVRYDFQFKDHTGKLWYGVQYGDNTEIAHCRRYKNQN